MSDGGRPWAGWALTLFVVLGLSLTVRIANNLRVARAAEDGGRAAWIATDPDSLYHMRRLARALDEGGRVAPRDPLLSSSFENEDGRAGAAIPWPPYYTQLLWMAAAPGAPAAGPARTRYVEHVVASAPLLFSALTSVLVALAAGLLAGRGAALVAGVYHACAFSALRYGYWGMGDHHAFVTLVHTALLFGLGSALARRREPWRTGAVLGALAGLALGSWVASTGHVLLVEATLACALLSGGGARVARLGTAFNLCAALTILPAVLLGAPGLPLVTLSMSHPLLLVVAAAGFWGLESYLERGPDGAGLRPSQTLFVFGVMTLGTFLAWWSTAGGLATGLAWARGENTFMGSITESQPLSLTDPALPKWLGFGVLALPFVWLPAALVCIRRRSIALLPWVVATPPLVWLALEQRRFAEALAVPLAVLLGWGAARFVEVCLGAPARTRARWILIALAVALPAAAHPSVLRTTWNRLRAGALFHESAELAHQRGLREAAEWIGARPQGPSRVLAEWDQGHLLEWGAGAVTIATNFGSYLGDGVFLEPWSFFLSEDAGAAERRLVGRDVRFVFVTSRHEQNLGTARRALFAGEQEPWDAARFERTVLGRLAGAAPGEELDFLRLVHSSPGVDARTGRPHARVWERVRGAEVVARGKPGATLRVQLRIAYPGCSDLFWSRQAAVDASGVARVRVPYSTAANGDGRARGALAWTLGARGGELAISELQVLAGTELRAQ